MIKFLLIINKQGHKRIAKYYDRIDDHVEKSMEVDLIKICLLRTEHDVNIVVSDNAITLAC